MNWPLYGSLQRIWWWHCRRNRAAASYRSWASCCAAKSPGLRPCSQMIRPSKTTLQQNTLSALPSFVEKNNNKPSDFRFSARTLICDGDGVDPRFASAFTERKNKHCIVSFLLVPKFYTQMSSKKMNLLVYVVSIATTGFGFSICVAFAMSMSLVTDELKWDKLPLGQRNRLLSC